MLVKDLATMQLFFLFLVHANGGRHVRRRTSIRLCTDGPWRLHWPCLVPWLLLETFVSVAWLRSVPIGQSEFRLVLHENCQLLFQSAFVYRT